MAASTTNRPLRAMSAICGAMLVAIGLAAIITSDFEQAAQWIVAGGFAVAGLTGLIVLFGPTTESG